MGKGLVLCAFYHALLFPSSSGVWTRRQCRQLADGVDCSGMDLRSIPEEIPDSLRVLNFSFNLLPVLHSLTLQRLAHLRHLDLTRCSVAFVYEESFKHQPELEVLVLIGNQLVFMAERAFAGPQALKHLSLAQTNVRSLSDVPAVNLELLETLDLRGNNIGSLLGLSRLNLQSLKVLLLDMNNVRQVHVEDLKPLSGMAGISISLKANDIADVEQGAFRSLDLTGLDLSGCLSQTNMSELLRGLQGAKTHRLDLGLYETDARRHTPSSALRAFCHIGVRDLRLQLHSFSDLDGSTFSCLQGLQSLDLTRAHLSSLPANLSGLTGLSRLVLDQNHFVDVCDVNANSFPRLAHLSLRGNSRKLNFSPGCLRRLEALEKLDLSLSLITPTGPCCNHQLDGLAGLTLLNLSYGSAMDWTPLPFSATPRLENLDCSRLLYTANGSSPFRNLRRLQTLNLSWTGTDLANEQILRGLASLRALELTGNRVAGDGLLRPELFGNTPLLQSLALAQCGLVALGEDAFQGLPRLGHVDLSGNRLLRPTTSAFASLDHVHLDFSGNAIALVDVRSVEVGNGSSVDLSRNPLACNCSNSAFIDWFKANPEKRKRGVETLCHTSATRIVDVELRCRSWTGWVVLGVALALVLGLALVYLVKRSWRRICRYTPL